jgi:hypothetical protein
MPRRPHARFALLLCFGLSAFASTPPVLVADRTAVRPGEPVSLSLTLADSSPYAVLGLHGGWSNWFAIAPDGSAQPISSPLWQGVSLSGVSTVPAGTTGSVSRFYTNTVAETFSPQQWPITLQAKNSFGESSPLTVWVGPQPNPAAGENAWINHTTATYTLTRTIHEWSDTTDGDGNTETIYDTTETVTESLPPGGTFVITNTWESAEDGSWSIGHQESITLTVAPSQLFAPLTLNRGVVSDSAATLVWPAAANGSTPVDYVIYRDDLPVGTTSALTFTNTGLSAGVTYAYSIRSRQGGVLSPTGPVLLVTTSPLTILNQPTSATLAAGANATFAVSATGPAPLTYQWRKDEAPLAGQTNATLTLAAVTDISTGRYSVVVTSAAGSVTSANATLAVNSQKPVIAPSSPITGTVGTPLSFSIPASHYPTVYYRLLGYFPDGISLNSATGLISGVPTGAGSFTATIAAGNSAGMALGTVTFQIAAAPPQPVPALQPQEVRITSQGSNPARPPFRIQVGNVGTTVTSSSGETATNYITEVAVSVDGVGTYNWNNYWSTPVNAPAFDMVFTDALSPHFNGQPRTSYRVTVRWTDYHTYDYTYEDDDGNVVSAEGIQPRWSFLYDGPFPIPPRTPQPLAINFPHPSNRVYDDGAFHIGGYVINTTDPAYTRVIFVIDSGPARIERQSMPNSTENVAWIVPTGVGPVTITAYAPGDSGYTSAVPVTRTLHITATPPVITANPVPVAVTAGARATLTVAATGTPPLTYQWRRGYRYDGGGNAIFGALSTTSPTLVFANAPIDATGDYWCEVTGPGGAVTSGGARLTVSPPPPPPPPTITSAATLTVVAGTSISHQLTTASPASSFLWDEGYLPEGVTLFSGVGLIQGNPTPASIGTYVVKLRASGSSVGPQFTLTLTVTNGSGQSTPVFSTQPVSKVVDAGKLVQLFAQATGAGAISYQWYKNGNALPDQRSAELTLLAASAADVGYYAVVARNSLGATASQSVTLTVSGVAPTGSTGQAGSLPNITTQPQEMLVMPGEPARFAVNASSATPLSYQWLRNGFGIEGATNATLLLPETSYRDNGARFAVNVANGAGTVKSDEAMLLVRTPVLSVSNLTVSVQCGREDSPAWNC